MRWWDRCSGAPQRWRRSTATTSADTARSSTRTARQGRRCFTSTCTCSRAGALPGLRDEDDYVFDADLTYGSIETMPCASLDRCRMVTVIHSPGLTAFTAATAAAGARNLIVT